MVVRTDWEAQSAIARRRVAAPADAEPVIVAHVEVEVGAAAEPSQPAPAA